MRRADAWTLGGLMWAGLALAPLILDEWWISLLSQYLAYGLFAMSLALIWGQCGLLCFGQALFFGAGAYAMSLVSLGMVPGLERWTSSYLGLAAAIVAPALIANLLGRFLFYGRGLAGAYFGIVTLAIAVVAERLAINWDYAGGLNGLMNVPPLDLSPLLAEGLLWDLLPAFYVILAVTVTVYVGLEALVGSRYGVVLRAIRDDEERTRYFGYDVARYKLTAFTLAAAVAGLAGALFVAQFGFTSPTLIGFGLSTEVLIWVTLGGRELLLAAFLGAVLVRSLESLLNEALGPYWLLVLGGVFVASVMLFPRGLAGEALHRLAAGVRGVLGAAARARR